MSKVNEVLSDEEERKLDKQYHFNKDEVDYLTHEKLLEEAEQANRSFYEKIAEDEMEIEKGEEVVLCEKCGEECGTKLLGDEVVLRCCGCNYIQQ
jgi:hypothetical protein